MFRKPFSYSRLWRMQWLIESSRIITLHKRPLRSELIKDSKCSQFCNSNLDLRKNVKCPFYKKKILEREIPNAIDDYFDTAKWMTGKHVLTDRQCGEKPIKIEINHSLTHTNYYKFTLDSFSEKPNIIKFLKFTTIKRNRNCISS